MATEIDKRVVEMQFDNKDFEKNCQASLTTLEKLKMALNFDGAKGLETMGKAASKVDLSNLSKGADEVTVKFSAMQIAGITAIQEITKALLNFGKNVWSSTFGQISSGGMARTLKIEQAMFQMNALAKNIKGVGEEQAKVNALIDKMKDAIDRSVTGTAYGYDAAAAVASQLMASGLTNADTMYNHLRAIAGAAAMTGRSFEDIGNIFTTVASNGRLMTMQLRQFSAAGLNLSATLAQSLGKTEEQINDMVTKGKISFEQFSTALYDAFGDAAGKADDTFNGVTSNIKAQLSRIGQLFTDPFVENVIPFFKEVKARIKDVNTVLKPVAKTWTEFFKYVSNIGTKLMKNLNVSRFRYFVNGVENILVALIEIIWTIGRAIREVFGQQFKNELHDGIVGFDQFTRKLIPTKEALESFKVIVKALLIPLKALWTIGVAVVKYAIYPLLNVFISLVSAAVKLASAFKPIIEELLSFVSNGEFLSNIISIITETLVNLAEVLVTIMECVGELISELTQSGLFTTMLAILKEIAILLANVITKALIFICNIINDILSLFNNGNITAFFDFLIGAVAYVLGVLMVIWDWFKNTLTKASEGEGVFADILKLFAEIWQIIKNIFQGEDINENLDNLGDIMVQLGKDIEKLWEKFKTFLHDLNAGKVIVYAFSIALILLILSIRNVLNAIAGIGNAVKEGVTNAVDTLKDIRKVLAGLIKTSPALQLLLGISIAIATLAISLKVLSEVPFEKLAMASIVLAAFAGGIMAFTVALSKMNLLTAGEGTLLIAPYLLSLGAAILMFSVALVILAKAELELKQIIAPLVAMAVIIALLTGAIVAINRSMQLMFPEEQKLAVSAGVILAFAASIAILTKCLLSMVGIPFKDAITGLLVMAGLIAAMTGAIAVMGAVGMTFGGGVGAFAFVMSFVLLLKAIQKISEFPFEQMINGLKNAASVVVGMIALYAAMVGISALAGGNVFMQNLAHLMFSFTALVGICAAAIILLGGMDQNTIARGTAVLTWLGIFFAGVTKFLAKSFDGLSSGMKTYKDLNILKSFSKFLIAFSGCIVLLVLACQIARGVSLGGWAAVITLMFSLATCILIVEKASAYTKRANPMVLVAFVAGLVGVLTMMMLLTYVDPDRLFTVTCSVMVVLGMLALVAAIFPEIAKKMNKASEEAKESKTSNPAAIMAIFLLGVIGIIASLASLTKASESLDTDRLSAVTVALAIVFVGVIALVGFITYFANKVKDTKKLMNVAGALTIIIASISIIGATLAGMTFIINDIDKVGLSLVAFGEVLLVFASVFILLKDFVEAYKKAKLDGNSMLKIAGSIFIIMSSLVIIAGSITGMAVVMSNTSYGVANSLVAFGEILLLFVVVMRSFSTFISDFKKTKLSTGDLLKISASVVIAMSSLVIIAGCITGMTLAIGRNNTTLLASLAAFGEILLMFVVVMRIFSEFIKKTKKLDLNDVLKIGGLIEVMNSAIIAIGGTISAMSVIIGKDTNTLLASLASFGEILLMFVVVMNVFADFVKKTKGTVKVTDIISTATSIVIMSSSLLIISGAISLMAVATGGNPDKIASTIAGFVLILVSFGAVMAALYLLNKKAKSSTKLLATAGAIALACSSLVLIAGAIAMLGDVKVDETFVSKMSALIIPFGLMVALFAIVAAIGDKIDPVGILAIGGSITIGAAGLLIIADAVVKVVESTKNIKPENLDTVLSIFKKFMLVLALLVGIGGVLGGLNILGAGVLIGIGVIIAAFILFAEGAKILAEAVDQVVETAFKINNIDINAEKVKNNIVNSFSGIADGIIASIPKITEATLYLIGAVLAVVLLVKNKAVLIGIAYVLAFLAGMEAALPAVLAMVSSIMKTIVDWLEAPGNMELIGSFFEKIGEMLVSIIGGALKGLIGEMADQFDAFLEKYNLSAPGVGLAEAAQKKAADTMTKDREHNAQLERLDNVLDYYHMYDDVANMSDEMWMKVVDDFNRIADAAKQSGKELDDQAKDIVMTYMELAPEEAVARLDSAYTGATETVEEFVDTVEVANEELASTADNASTISGTLTNNLDEATDSVTDFGDAAEAAGDKASDAMEEASEDAEEFSVDWDAIKEKVNSYGEGFKNSLKSIDIKSLGKKLGVDTKALGSALGKITGTSFGEDYEYTMEYYMEDAMKKVYDKAGQWQYKWQTFKNEQGEQIYSSAEAYATAMMDESTNKTSYGLKKLADFFGISLDVNDSLTDGVDILGDYGDAMDSVGTAADETKSKLEEFRDGVRDSIAQAMHGIFDEVSEQEYIDPEEMLYRMEENTRRVGEWAQNIATLAARGMSEGLLNELKDMGPQGAAKVQAFVDMTDEQLKMANRRWAAADFLPDYGTKEIEAAYRKAGFNASLGFSNGIDPKAADEAAKNLGDNSVNALEETLEEHSPSKRTERDGINLTKGLANGMTNAQAQGIIRDASRSLGTLLFRYLESEIKPDKMRNLAGNTLAGFENGLSAKMPSILSKITGFCGQIINQFQRVLNMHSPSRVMEDLGVNTMAGYGKGLEEESTNVESIAEKSAEDILNSMSEQIAAITNSVGEEGVYEPVIRPVFDMTAIEQGYSDIQSWFANSNGISLNGNLSRLTPTTRDNDSYSDQRIVDAINNINNDDVVREIGQLREDISQLQSAMTNLQVVMNTGALVGQLVDPMDSALGMKSLMNTRGRY